MNNRLARVVEVLHAIVREARSEKLTFMAGSIAYHAFVSLLPLLLLLFILISTIGNQTLEQSLLSVTQAVLTPGTEDDLIRALERSRRSTSLSILGIVILLWGTLRIFRGLDTAFSDIYESEAENTIVDQFTDSLVVLTTFGLAVLAAVVIDVVIPSYGPDSIAWFVQQLVLVVGLALAFFPMYYIFPDTDVSMIEILPGVLIVAFGLTTVSSLFGIYIEFSQQSTSSGNLVANIVLLLTWLYASGFVILLGAVVNAVLSNRSRDVSIDPVLGGIERGTRHALSDRATLLRDIERTERLLDDAEEVVISVDGEEVTFTPPHRVRSDTDSSSFGLRAGWVGLELEWRPRKK